LKEKINAQIDTIDMKLENLKGKTSESAEKTKSDMERLREDLKKDLKRVEESTKSTWKDVSTSVKEDLNKARNKVGKWMEELGEDIQS
jgi:ElaB/YqjD/DUF883 family membrane-anchored ribosome-binding protein